MYGCRQCQFHFDAAFDGFASQWQVYAASAKKLVPSIMEGVNGTVFVVCVALIFQMTCMYQ